MATVREKEPISDYLATLHVPAESKLVGQKLEETKLSGDDVTVLAIVRDGVKTFPRGNSTLEPGDLLIVHGARDGLIRVAEGADLEFEAEQWSGDADPSAEGTEIVEVMVMPSSALHVELPP